MSFGYKGSVKLGYDTVSRINIATPLNLLQEKVLVYFTEHHTVSKLRHTPKSHTEIELVTDSITEILCVWTLTGENEKISCLSSEHDYLFQLVKDSSIFLCGEHFHERHIFIKDKEVGR